MNSKSRDKTKTSDHHSSNVQLTYNEKKLENTIDEGNKNSDNEKRRWILNWARKRILYN